MGALDWTRRPKETEEAKPKQHYWQGVGVKPPQARPQNEKEKDEAFFRQWAKQMREGQR